MITRRLQLFGHAWHRTVLLLLGLVLPAFTLLAAPPPIPPPLPGGASPGGAQPVVPPPILPLPETNLQINIPPASERPLQVNQGVRVFVRKFQITGVIGDRRAGIIPADIQSAVDKRFAQINALVNKQREAAQHLGEHGTAGLTKDKQKQLTEFMQALPKTESQPDRQKAYQSYMEKLQQQRLQQLQGLTIGQLQQIADVVTKYYHDRGYFLARAIIPTQEVNNGIITIRVLEGRLEKVVPTGNKMYSDSVLTKPFKPLVGDLVSVRKTEDALLTLTQYPGLSAFGVFKPGDYVGTTDLVINVQKERNYDANVRADNEGTQYTGRNRLIGTVDWNNPTGDADLLRIQALKAFNPDNSIFGDIHYEHPFFDPNNTIAMDVSRNSFDVSGSGIASGTLGGISKIATLSLQRAFQRSREQSVIGTIDLTRQRADTQFLGQNISQDDDAILGLQLNYDSIDSSLGIINTAYIRLERGLPGILGVPSNSDVLNQKVTPPPSRFGRNGQPALPEFTVLILNYQLFKSFPENQSLLLRLNGQYSPDMLTSLNQFVIGGVDSVRAVPTSQFLTDKGIFGSIEYSVRAPGFADKPAFGGFNWGQVLSFKIFSDAAVGLLNNAVNTSTERVAVEGNGVGVEFTWPGKFTANVQWAHLNGGARPGVSPSDPTAIPDATQIWADITFTF
ncbi:MAG: ShlB/FhaC/HecB family hemolysin secretion/activation protein [Gammaproteobacteria bacterium]|nr:ShlB/FhaC/HecB family hemolysin secretion/activation protein [Gammaproteobacteria bacterium]